MSSKKWFISVIFSVLIILLTCGLCVFGLDPYFHYRKPNNSLTYHFAYDGINVECYVNNGIIRNFEYDAVITGTSITENFKSSEFDSLFQVHSIKVPFSGAAFKEIGDNCKSALTEHPELKIIFRSFDCGISAVQDKDVASYDSYPVYLYDDNLLNDVNYLLNKDSLIRGCAMNIIMSTIKGREPFSFDGYMNDSDLRSYGKEVVLASFKRPLKADEVVLLNEEEKSLLNENIKQNIIELAEEYPDTRFILFFSPHNICYWDILSQNGMIMKEIQIQEQAIEMLLPYSNIELYSFCNNYDMICNLDNYRDPTHFREEINSDILQWVSTGEYRITKDNYKSYLSEIADFYCGYDYESIYK